MATQFAIDRGAASPDRVRRNFQHLADFVASTVSYVVPLTTSVSTLVSGISTAVGVRISAVAGNKLVLLPDGLYIST